MSDNNEAGSFATAGSGKSEHEVAFDLLSKLKGQGVWGERNVGSILDLYAECLDATKGLRSYEGQKRVDVPIQKLETSKATPVQQAAPAQTQAAQAPQQQPAQAQPVQAQAPQTAPLQAQQAVPQQPVHAQQQVLQQAFKQG